MIPQVTDYCLPPHPQALEGSGAARGTRRVTLSPVLNSSALVVHLFHFCTRVCLVPPKCCLNTTSIVHCLCLSWWNKRKTPPLGSQVFGCRVTGRVKGLYQEQAATPGRQERCSGCRDGWGCRVMPSLWEPARPVIRSTLGRKTVLLLIHPLGAVSMS